MAVAVVNADIVKRMQKTTDTCFFPFNILFDRFIFSIPPLENNVAGIIKTFDEKKKSVINI